MVADSQNATTQKQRFCILCWWFGALAHLGKNSRRVAWGGLALVPIMWMVDSMVDLYVFGESESLYDAFFQPDQVELWMRSMASIVFVVFGIWAALLLDHAERVERELRASNAELERLKADLERLVVVDPLTGVFNRRKFHESLDRALATAARHQHLFALLMIDIDHFKKINDRFGHQAGDEVLRILCGLIDSSIRSTDQMFRVGGEEFCLVAALQDKEQADALAEKVRQVIESHTFPGVGKVTVSVGIAYFREGDTQQDIYARADEALYQAKHNGRNCVMRGE